MLPSGRQRCVVVDVETTGLSPLRGGRILEIGAVAVEGDGIVDEFHALINPGARIARQAAFVHGITSDMLAGMPKPEEVLPVFHRFLKGSALIAHNASFDATFLRYEFSRLGLGFNNTCYCTLAMCRRRYPKLRDHKLGTVYRHLFGALPDGATLHRALDDARMVARVWLEMNKRSA